MTHILDSNACINYLRDPNSNVRVEIAARDAGDVVVCSPVVGELRRGVLLSSDPAHK